MSSISAGIPETAVAMLAKDGERVPFHALFHMTGAVEMWLTRWARRNAILHISNDSLGSFLIEECCH